MLVKRLPLALGLTALSGCFCAPLDLDLSGCAIETFPPPVFVDLDVGCPFLANADQGLTAHTHAPPLSAPTAVGSLVGYRLEADPNGEDPLAFVSSDPSVIEVARAHELRFVGPGFANVDAVDGFGDVRQSWTFESAVATEVRLAEEPVNGNVVIVDGFFQAEIRLFDAQGRRLLEEGAIEFVATPDERTSVEVNTLCTDADDGCPPCVALLEVTTCSRGQLPVALIVGELTVVANLELFPGDDCDEELADGGTADAGASEADAGASEADAGEADAGDSDVDAGDVDAGDSDVDAGDSEADAGT